MNRIRIEASVLHGKGDLRIDERSLDRPGEGEVQVAVRATGLCGSDLHYFQHFANGNIQVREPLTLGHESSGVVVALGRGVKDLAVGDRVALEVGLPCGQCELCNAGRYNICRDMRFRSSAKAYPHAQGTLQDRINHPAKWCHKLPDVVSLDQGALVEPLSVAMHARKRAGLANPRRSTVVILGAGAVGLLCAAVNKEARARTVVIADLQKDRVDFALKHGFADVGVTVPNSRPQTVEGRLAYAQQVATMLKQAQRESGDSAGEASVTYECTGAEACLQIAIYATGPGGKVMIIGMGTPVQTLPISEAALREVDLVGVFRYADTYPAAIELLANETPRLPDLSKLITQRYTGLKNVPQAFEMAGRVKDDHGKLVIKVMIDTEKTSAST